MHNRSHLFRSLSPAVFSPLLRLSPPPSDHDYIYNLDETEGLCDLFDVPIMNLWPPRLPSDQETVGPDMLNCLHFIQASPPLAESEGGKRCRKAITIWRSLTALTGWAPAELWQQLDVPSSEETQAWTKRFTYRVSKGGKKRVVIIFLGDFYVL